jgi:sulfate transport system ATP-binding protein
MSIEARQITKQFGSFKALDDVSLHVQPGELVALLGPSGSGKTTLLRIIAGLEFADAGRVLFSGQDVTDLPASERKAGFAFQHYALFRHLSVFENVAFGLRVRPRSTRPPEAEIRARVMKLLRLVQLEPLAGRFPSQLSGGQQQRVSLARALAVEPRVLLLDEPFGALDAQVRKELRRWLRRLHDEVHLTSLFVTHDQEEALEVADRVVVMNKGRIEQAGTPEEVYDAPANPFVLGFLGHVNFFHGRVREGHVRVGEAEIRVGDPDGVSEPAGDHATVYFRPHEVKVVAAPDGAGSIPATILHIHAAGSVVRLDLQRRDDGSRFEVEVPRDQWRALNCGAGSEVFVHLRKVRVTSDNRSLYTEDFHI